MRFAVFPVLVGRHSQADMGFRPPASLRSVRMNGLCRETSFKSTSADALLVSESEPLPMSVRKPATIDASIMSSPATIQKVRVMGKLI
jgi:hypothetical protein